MKKRLNIYLREKTYNLLLEYQKIEEFDLSTCIDILLSGRLEYLNKVKRLAENQLIVNEINSKEDDQSKIEETNEIINELKEKWKKY